jgi:signal transduction histidine kinase/ActR/RegA family two-component response regulator
MNFTLATLLDALHQLESSFLFIRDKDLRFTLVGKKAPDLTGRQPEQLSGLAPAEAYASPAAAAIESGDKHVLQGHSLLKEEFLDLGAGPRWYRSCKVPLRDGKGEICGLLGTAEDLTPFKKLEKNQRRQLNLMHILESTSRGFLSAAPEDLDDRIETALGEIGQVLETDRAYLFLFSRNNSRMDNTHEWTSPNTTAEKGNLQDIETSMFPWWCAQVIAGRSIHIPDVSAMPPEAEAEQEILAAQGIRSLIVTPLMLGERALGFVGFDAVTDHRAWLEEEVSILGTLADTFSQALNNAAMTRQLQASKQAAEAANAAKNRFLLNISHETRTPLNGIFGNLSLLSEAEMLPTTQRQQIMAALRSCRKLDQVFDTLMDAADLENGSVALNSSRFCLPEMLQSIKETFQDEADLKNLLFEISIGPDIPKWITGDERRLRQLLFNLVDNGIKFTSHGNVHLMADHFCGPHGDVRLMIVIEDSGTGFNPILLDTLSSPFSQADESRDRTRQGTGTGLYIAKCLIRLMGGEFCVDSAPDQGSTVVLSLPIKPARAPEDSGSLLPEDTPLHIMVVEDDPVNMMLTTRFLENAGCRVTCAWDGLIALNILKTEQFDCIFMDIQMPGMDGIQATRRVRTDPLLRHSAATPIIALTAHREQEEKKHCLAAGMNDFLTKPISPKILLQRLSDVMKAV